MIVSLVWWRLEGNWKSAGLAMEAPGNIIWSIPVTHTTKVQHRYTVNPAGLCAVMNSIRDAIQGISHSCKFMVNNTCNYTP